MRSRMIGLAAVVVFATLALVACTTSTEQGTVGVERSQSSWSPQPRWTRPRRYSISS